MDELIKAVWEVLFEFVFERSLPRVVMLARFITGLARRSAKEYKPLTEWLSSQHIDKFGTLHHANTFLTFSEIENISQSSLPSGAWESDAWWANDRSHA